jgi:2-methylcitrate dehydratase PrpD
MIRRDFFKTLAISGFLIERPNALLMPPVENFPSSPGLTKYVAEFVVNTKYQDIPEDVMTLGKKTILDGFGLALAGSASVMGPLIRKYIETAGFASGPASIIGTGMKAQPRFAALANGISIHADDYDDMGSGLHVTAPVLPAVFSICE